MVRCRNSEEETSVYGVVIMVISDYKDDGCAW